MGRGTEQGGHPCPIQGGCELCKAWLEQGRRESPLGDTEQELQSVVP